ncbi:MAG TPA: methyltransferase domain-containing protein [Candidatus Acidoferrales bacterium]|nr:methyltransferase domain-containing protein [Candidatus Acidoferrales bacterium]
MPALFNNALLQLLACPYDRSKLRVEADALVCEHAHHFPIEDGIPIFAENPRREPIPLNMGPCPHPGDSAHVDSRGEKIDPFVNDWIVNTNGNLYWRARGKLPRYPVPNWPAGPGDGKIMIDIGCGWGRWCIAAARSGFAPIGMDVHVDALAAATRVSRQLGARADFICSDAEHLPFSSGSVDLVFSYSVLQHLDKSKVRGVFQEISRILRPEGICLLQLPNAFGLLSIAQQLRRGFRQAKSGTFEMRYWTHAKIRQALEQAGFSNITISTDGFFSQNPQLTDLDLLSPAGRLLVRVSSAGCRAANLVPILTRIADSLWIQARTRISARLP